MSIDVYPKWNTNLLSKNGRKTSSSYETKASKSFIPTRKMWLWCLIMKRMEIIIWIHVYPNWKTNFNSRKGRKGSFSDETKALISSIPMKRMCLWCPMTKKKEIIMSIHVYPNWKTNFDSKNGRKTSFSYETKLSKSFITIRRMCV